MNTLAERIKLIRNKLGMTQKEFGEKLGIAPNTVTNYETDRRTPSNQVIYSICREFDVSENWLRTDIGEMFNEKPTDFEELLKKENLSSTAEQLVRIILDLKEDTRQDLITTLKKHVGDTDVVSGFIEEFTELYNKKSHEDS